MSVLEKTPMALLTDAQRFAAIIEFSDDAIITTDVNGVITSWNAGAQRLFGYSPEEAVGRSILLLIPPERVTKSLPFLNASDRANVSITTRLFAAGKTGAMSIFR